MGTYIMGDPCPNCGSCEYHCDNCAAGEWIALRAVANAARAVVADTAIKTAGGWVWVRTLASRWPPLTDALDALDAAA